MGFIPHKNEDGAVAPYEYLPATNQTVKYGEAMVFSSGKLAKCGAEAVPEYIAMCDETIASNVTKNIPVIHVDKDTLYKTTLSAAGTSLALGNKVTVASDGLRVTATTTNGVAEIIGMDGTATGSAVYVRF